MKYFRLPVNKSLEGHPTQTRVLDDLQLPHSWSTDMMTSFAPSIIEPGQEKAVNALVWREQQGQKKQIQLLKKK